MKVPSRLQIVTIVVARGFLGFVFLYASIDKILYPEAFAEIVYNYRILPDGMIHVTAVVLPWLELLLGLFLILDLWLGGAVLVANALFMVFLAAIALNIARGLDIDCGCFSSDGSPAPMFYYLGRDAFFFLLSLLTGFLVLGTKADPQKT
jgi:uncharacterized membrane protein YphA (DoxX/SURF4 family)